MNSRAVDARIGGLAAAAVFPHTVVGIPSGLGHVEGGQWSAGTGANPNHLVSADLVDELTGLVARQGMRVNITKAEEED